ncbi:hypothetical protein V490_06000 [Pseudogymnoascus sp. VKM F-3557]|nr:hypothetical protein V490_06000 [Pseudogymnoascus sp. VKM F-3557]
MANDSTTAIWSRSPLPPKPKLPTYQISRAPDLTLIYDPPVGSQELADALSCHYPFQKGLQQKMLQASIDFLNSEKGKITTPTPDVTPTPDATWTGYRGHKVTTPLMLHKKRPDFVASTLNTPWDIKSGKTCVKKPRGRTRGLEASERERVAKNRGNACERHRKSRTKCHQSLCVDNKLNSCDYHRESNTECTFTCLDNLLVAEGLDMDEDNIAQETSFQSANLPAYYADLELPERTDSQQLQQFVDPKMISAQHVQDPSMWNNPPTLELDSMPLFDSDPRDESYSNQFPDRVSAFFRPRRSISFSACRWLDDRPPRPRVSRRRILTWNHGEGMLDHLKQAHPFDDVPTLLGQIEQAERRFDGDSIQHGVGVPSIAAELYEFGDDSSVSPGGNLGMASVDSSLLREYSNQTDRNGYYTPLSSSTTTPSPRRRSPWCHRERLHHDCANQPSSDADADTIDIVGLHGLNGDYQRRWTRTLPSGAKINWLQDLVPTQIPRAHVLPYGYNSSVNRRADLARWETMVTASLCDGIRRKSGPRRGYVETLEERHRNFHEFFKTRYLSAAKSADQARPSFTAAKTRTSSRAMLAAANADFGVNNPDIVVANNCDHEYWELSGLAKQLVIFTF